MIPRQTPEGIERMREAGAIVADVLELCAGMAQPGIATADLDREAEGFIRRAGATPLFKGYRGYPATLCTSINEQVVHGIPGTRRLVAGELLSLDVGVRFHGFCADAALTVAVGTPVDPHAQRLLDVCRDSLGRGIATLKPNMRLSTLCRAIQLYVETNGFSVVRKYTGHGIGREMHEEPQVPNFWARSMSDPVLPPGAVLAIEPMINAGRADTQVLDDGWTVVTRDGSLSAHFEHTVAITESGPDILTLKRT